MVKALIFALIAALGNAIFVFGQKGSQVTRNPFVFMLGAVFVCTLLFLISTFCFESEGNIAYLIRNIKYVLISGAGFFITFIGFYLLFSKFGASQYVVYAVLSIITTSIGVGVICYKEPFNIYYFIAIIFAVLTIAFFCYGQKVAKTKHINYSQIVPKPLKSK